MRTALEINGQHPHHGMGKRPMAVVGNIPGECSPNRKPYRQPKAAEEIPVKPMEEAGAASKIDSPGETSTTANQNEMPPLEEEEAIAELDAAIDEAGDEGEEEPKPLDEVDIEERSPHQRRPYAASGVGAD